MKPAVVLRKKLQGKEPVLGLLSTFHFWRGLVEIAMDAGYDYLIIDLEHLTHDAEMVADACAIGRRAGFPILIRPASAEFTPVRLALDLGPCGLLIPYVQSVADLDTVRDAVYMRPRGYRRPGGPATAWMKDYHYASWKRTVEDNLIILPQIESQHGLNNVDAIASHPLTTAMAIGPYDLSADLGVCWQPEHKLLVNAFEKIRRAARAVDKNMWVIGDGPTMLNRGFNFICLSESTMFLKGALTQLAANTRAQARKRKRSAGQGNKVPI